LAFLGLLISTTAAYLGGHLVYSEQIGVDHTADQSTPETFVPVLAVAELAENQLRRVHANGMPILLLRQSERIYALGETCAHLGGPLAEGRLDGTSVVCPWHGSRYALENGRVLYGPSAHAQPSFEVRVRNGQIEVRAADN
jgi:nitrite reductase/ring-hydroxylating ferredoxin subunit